jgi:DNA-binding NarL/FixJ family response regulator
VSADEIASKLNLMPQTIRPHLANIARKIFGKGTIRRRVQRQVEKLRV